MPCLSFGGGFKKDRMESWEIMRARHSVRVYEPRRIPGEIVDRLREEIDACNRQGDLSMRLVTDEPRAFRSFLAHYGKFSGVENYIVAAGRAAPDLEERVGYYGERVVLAAQALGLNSCWVALTVSKRWAKRAAELSSGEKLVCVIALGYGKTQGVEHKSKRLWEVGGGEGFPAWYNRGVAAALLAPTALNQQKFRFSLVGDGVVRLERTKGFYSDVDLGIVRQHFEEGAGRENFRWE